MMSAPEISPTAVASNIEPAEAAEVSTAPRRFRHRKRGSIEVVIGEATLSVYSGETSDGSELKVYHLKGKLRATTTYLTPIEGAIFLGVAELQTAEPLGPGVHQLTFYRGESDGRLWLRPTAEFNDGRFEEILLDPGAKGDDLNGR